MSACKFTALSCVASGIICELLKAFRVEAFVLFSLGLGILQGKVPSLCSADCHLCSFYRDQQMLASWDIL